MALKLANVNFSRNVTPVRVYAVLQDEDNNSVNVNFPLEAHYDLEHVTVQELENFAKEAAKKLHV
ncbi:hypothetical protein CFB82_41190 [Burkholderia sp. HI2714]|uniref:hypothetical protein n=1 Tax=Burkholderia sp. HI2714 TaxID=2015359 RepID=UPI000B7AE52B|nr:hypothetical protein [Burkholderia sp. HI2714]OXJ21480.1 hypothetical protein CFB82_41190 [Burkholderia sp. HI2714]